MYIIQRDGHISIYRMKVHWPIAKLWIFFVINVHPPKCNLQFQLPRNLSLFCAKSQESPTKWPWHPSPEMINFNRSIHIIQKKCSRILRGHYYLWKGGTCVFFYCGWGQWNQESFNGVVKEIRQLLMGRDDKNQLVSSSQRALHYHNFYNFC